MKIAKNIYDVEKYPPTAKVMEWLKQLGKKGIISKTEAGFLSKIEPLANEIALTLKEEHEIELNEFERYVLERFLDRHRIHIVKHELIIKKGYFKRDIDSARELMEQFGSYMMIQQLLSRRDFNINTKAEFDKKWLIYSDQRAMKEEDRAPLTDLIPSELRISFLKLSPLYSMFQKILSYSLTSELFDLWLRSIK